MARYMFLEWRDELGNLVGATPSISLLIDRDKTLTAYYQEAPITYNLTVATTTGGTTNPSPGAYKYAEGTSVSVQAIPSSGYNFSNWILDGVTRTENPITVLMNQDHSLTAYFSTAPPPQYTLAIATTVGGTTNPSPGSHVYAQGTSVSVQALPSTGYAFDHWILDGATRTDNPITIIMNANHSLTAYFAILPPPYQILTINTTVGGNTSPPPGSYQYLQGATAQVTAIPSTGYVFDHWTLDGLTFTSNPISVIMNTDHLLTAYFSEILPPNYNLNIASTATGTTDPAPGVHTYLSGSTVTVTATPQADFYFDHWELDGVVRTENPITIIMDKDHALLAVFASTPPSPPISPYWVVIPVIVGGVAVGGYLLFRKK